MRIYFIFNEMRMSKFLFIFNVNSGMKQGGGGRDEVWDRETMFSQLAKRSPSVVVSA